MVFDLLYIIYFVCYFPVLLFRGKWHDGMAQRFGGFSRSLACELLKGENIWAHAVSVGEVAALEGVIQGLRQKYPAHRLVLSVATRAGHEFALRKYPSDVRVIWAPFDLSVTVRRFIMVLRPVLYVVAETELWPNLFGALDRMGVPIVLVNARISDEALPRYSMFKGVFKGILNKVSLVCAQSAQDAARFIFLGADKARVQVVGNVKFDVPLAIDGADHLALRKRFGFGAYDKIFVAASTHPGEDEVVLDACRSLLPKIPRLRLVIAPRHPERASDVGRLALEKGFQPFYYGKAIGPAGAEDVMIVDAIGFLVDLYAVADVVFIGKSFGIPRRGGQNPIEPAAWGRPVIMGPHMENFRDVMRLFREAGAVIEIADGKGLARAIEEVLGHPERMAGLSVRAKAVVEANRGAAGRSVDLMAALL